jgi:hypothetical protein
MLFVLQNPIVRSQSLEKVEPKFQGALSNVIPKIENTKLPVPDFNEKVCKFLSP